MKRQIGPLSNVKALYRDYAYDGELQGESCGWTFSRGGTLCPWGGKLRVCLPREDIGHQERAEDISAPHTTGVIERDGAGRHRVREGDAEAWKAKSRHSAKNRDQKRKTGTTPENAMKELSEATTFAANLG